MKLTVNSIGLGFATLITIAPAIAQDSAKTETGIANSGTQTFNGPVSIGNTLGSPPFQECSKNYLQLQLDDRIGTLVSSGKNDARRFRVTVGNPTNDCTAVVKTVSVEVVDSVEDHHPALEALMSVFKFKVVVSPADKGKTIAVNGGRQFSYPPHSNPDQYVFDVFSKRDGYSYALRFRVDWTDLRTKTSNSAQSWIAVASFPDGRGEFNDAGDVNAWRLERLLDWRKKYDQSDEALKDANVEDPGHPLMKCDEIKFDSHGEMICVNK